MFRSYNHLEVEDLPPEDGHTTETCSGYWIKYSKQCCVRRKPWTWNSNTFVCVCVYIHIYINNRVSMYIVGVCMFTCVFKAQILRVCIHERMNIYLYIYIYVTHLAKNRSASSKMTVCTLTAQRNSEKNVSSLLQNLSCRFRHFILRIWWKQCSLLQFHPCASGHTMIEKGK
jgi:hypothetical protein